MCVQLVSVLLKKNYLRGKARERERSDERTPLPTFSLGWGFRISLDLVPPVSYFTCAEDLVCIFYWKQTRGPVL